MAQAGGASAAAAAPPGDAAHHRVVLFPVADDDQSEAVFLWALDQGLVQPTDKVHLLHVIAAVANRDLRMDYFNQHDDAALMAAQHPMLDRRFIQPLQERGLQAVPVVVHLVQASEDSSTLGRVICRHAEQSSAALVVMGCPERSRLRDLLVGNAALYVQKHCSRPVTLVTRSQLPGSSSGGGGLGSRGGSVSGALCGFYEKFPSVNARFDRPKQHKASGVRNMARYNNKTLQGNWWEDRQQEGAGLGARMLASSHVRTAARCLPWALPADEQAALFQTTSRAAVQHALTSPPLAPKRRPRMVSAVNAGAELASRQHRSGNMQGALSTEPRSANAIGTDRSVYPDGIRADAAATVAADHPERFTTTYERVFDQERASALATHPRSDFVTEKSFPLSSKLHADTYQVASLCSGPPPGGRGGGRGEFTRWPYESGSRYGVSVFADEYSAGRL